MTAVRVAHLRCDQTGCVSEWAGRDDNQWTARRDATMSGWRGMVSSRGVIDDYCPAHARSGRTGG